MTSPRIRICFVSSCRRRIPDHEGCWRDNAGNIICNRCYALAKDVKVKAA